VHELCRELVRRGIDVSVFTSNADDPKGILDVAVCTPQVLDGVEVTYFPLRTRAGSFAEGLASTLRKRVTTYDLLHLHGIYQHFTFAGARAGQVKGIPYVISPRGMLDPFAIKRKGWLKKLLFVELVGRRDLNRAAGIHYTADEEKQLVERFGFRAPGFVVPNGINPSEYSEPCGPIRLLDKYPHLAKKQIVLYLGRLDPKKGLELLIEAIARLAGSHPDLHLLVAGPDQTPYARSLKNKVMANGLKNRVDFTGFLTGDDKLWALYLAKMSILPSYSENFGIALVEALCCERPVITTKRVNIASDVIEYNAGLVTDCDVNQIADAIVCLLDHSDQAILMGKRGKKMVESRFRWDKVAHDLIEVYEDILSGQKKSLAWRVRT
jgi:glycosyltransferase involved in cell wall biosynthesis